MTGWQRRADAQWRFVLDDVVILSATEEEPFALSGGAALWRGLEESRTAEELGVPGELLQGLRERGAIQEQG